MVGFVYMSEITYFILFCLFNKVPDLTTAMDWFVVCSVLDTQNISRYRPSLIYFQMHLCVSPCFCSGSRFTSMWQLKIHTFIMRCLIVLFVAFHSFSIFMIFLIVNANLCMILFYLRQLLSMTQYILNYSPFLFLHKFNLRWLRNSFSWHAVADICCLRQQSVIFHYFHNLPLSQKLDPRLTIYSQS